MLDCFIVLDRLVLVEFGFLVEDLPLFDELDSFITVVLRVPTIKTESRQHVGKVERTALPVEGTHEQGELEDHWCEEAKHKPARRVK